MALAGRIGGALRGDPRSVMALETMGTDAAVVQEAMGLLGQRAEQPAVGHFAAQIILRHARSGEGADLGALCTECLQVTLAAPSMPGHRQLLSAAAAAATRAGPEATLQVHAEAMRLARAAQLSAGADDGGVSALAALQLVHAMAEESGGAAVPAVVREALVAQGADVFRLITAVLCGSAGERGVAGGLECLTEWAGTLGVGMDAVLATDGLLASLCTLAHSTDESVLDSLADCLEGLLTRPFAGHSAAVRRAAKASTRPEDEPWRSNGPALEQLGVAVDQCSIWRFCELVAEHLSAPANKEAAGSACADALLQLTARIRHDGDVRAAGEELLLWLRTAYPQRTRGYSDERRAAALAALTNF